MAARRAAGAHAVRIVGGMWKRTPLAVPDVPELRPTPDRVRQAVFNWLGQRLDGCRCLDLFAGTGALGLEAASRGASEVVLVERDPRAAQAIRGTLARLSAPQVSLVQGDALAVLSILARQGRQFDRIFLDPPFRQDWLKRLWPALAPVLADEALVYVESEAALPAQVALGAGNSRQLHTIKADKAGQVHYHLLRCHCEPAAGSDSG
jgi:16S rRNA (guanine966-N2)-methyltransferase